MRKTVITALFSLAVAAALTTAAWAQELVVGGQAVGIQVGTKGVLIAGLSVLAMLIMLILSIAGVLKGSSGWIIASVFLCGNRPCHVRNDGI